MAAIATTGTDRKRILAVDDTEDTLELIRIALGSQYDVLTLSNPMDLFEIMDMFEPDLLVLDVMMPKITGFQLIEMLKKSPATKDLPVIFLSAKASAGEIKHGYKLGAMMYLTKPFQPDRLLKNIEAEFSLHPPRAARKAHKMEELVVQLEQKNSFRKGHAQLTSNVVKKEVIVDYRKKMEEKVRRDEEEQKKARMGWNG